MTAVLLVLLALVAGSCGPTTASDDDGVGPDDDTDATDDDSTATDDDSMTDDDSTLDDDSTPPDDDSTPPDDDSTPPDDDSTSPDDDSTSPDDDSTPPDDDAVPDDDSAADDDTVPAGPIVASATDADAILDLVYYGRYTVASAGDVNGDGYDDIMAAYTDTGGWVWLKYGPVSGLIDLETEAEAVVVGESGDLNALSIAGAGDVDGDGYADIYVADARYAPDGAVYLLRGPLYGTVEVGDWAGVQDATIAAPSYSPYDDFGTWIAPIHDINGDGQADIAVSRTYNAETFIYDGPFLGYVDSPRARLFDSKLPDSGDSDGDGISEVVAKKAASPFGAALWAGPLFGDVDDSAADAFWYSADYTSPQPAIVPDIDGDGIDDVILEAGSLGSESVYVFAGPFPTEVPAGSEFAHLFTSAPDASGYSSDSVGDVDGDGSPDVLVGAPFDDALGTHTGATYLVYGPVAGEIDLATSPEAVKYVGEVEMSQCGIEAHSAGDVNGDGLPDYLFTGDEPSPRIYVFFGHPR